MLYIIWYGSWRKWGIDIYPHCVMQSLILHQLHLLPELLGIFYTDSKILVHRPKACRLKERMLKTDKSLPFYINFSVQKPTIWLSLANEYHLILHHKTTPGQRIFVSHFQPFLVYLVLWFLKPLCLWHFCLSAIYFTFSFFHRTRLVCEMEESDRRQIWWGRLREYNTFSLQKLMSNAVGALFNSLGKAQTVPLFTGQIHKHNTNFYLLRENSWVSFCRANMLSVLDRLNLTEVPLLVNRCHWVLNLWSQ